MYIIILIYIVHLSRYYHILCCVWTYLLVAAVILFFILSRKKNNNVKYMDPVHTSSVQLVRYACIWLLVIFHILHIRAALTT